MDRYIGELIWRYHHALTITFKIIAIIGVWVVLTGCVRFAIAVYRRKKGIYPPATSQMEEH